MENAQLEDVWQLLEQIFHFQLFNVGGTSITVASIAIFFILFTVLIILSNYISKLLASKVLSRLRVDAGLAYTFKRVTMYILVALSGIISFQFIGLDLGGLAVIFGLLSVGIGFGLQNLTANFIAGLVLLFERPIKIGDKVTVGDTLGDVIAINMRSTTIRSIQNISIIVPNSQFVSEQVINWSHRDPTVRLDLDIGVSYGSDLDTVLQSLREVAAENPDVLDNPAPEVMHFGFGDSAWNMQLRVWIRDPNEQFRIRSDINCAVVRKFRDRGVEIPFPQRDLHIRSPLPVPLRSQASEESSGSSDKE